MAEVFDPYRKWLGIPPEEQPPNHYRLLGIGLFEGDADVIEGAADRQMSHIQRHQLGQYAAISQRLLNELSAARLCLLKPDRKDAYDRALRKHLSTQTPAARPTPAAPAAAARTRRPNPAETVTEDADEMPGAESPEISALPQHERRPVGKRRPTAAQKSATGKSAIHKSGSKKAGSKQSGSSGLIVAGSIAAGVAVIAIIAIVASRDTAPPPVAQKPAEQSGKPSTATQKPAPAREQPPRTKTANSDDPEPESEPAPETSVADPPAKTPAASDTDPDAPISGNFVAPPDVARVVPAAKMPDPATLVKVQPKPLPVPADKSGNFELAGHTQPILGIAAHPDSNQVVSISANFFGGDQPIRIWNLTNRDQLPIPMSEFHPLAVTFGTGGDELYMTDEAGAAIRRPFPIGENAILTVIGSRGKCISVRPGRDVFAVGGTNGLFAHSQTQNSDVFTWKSPVFDTVNATYLSPDGGRLWAGCSGSWESPSEARNGKDFVVHLWDGPKRNYFELDGHNGCIWGIAGSRDGSRVATASHDRTVRVWDAKTHKSLKTLVGHDGPVYAVAISPDGKLVLSSGADKTVRLWDTKSGHELRRFEGHTDTVRAVALTPDGKYALSGGTDKVLRVWDLGTPSRRPAAVAAKPEPATKRAAVPSQEAVEEASKLIREVFADDFKQAKKASDKIALAEKLLKQASDSQTDTERYALLTEARSLAAAGGSPALAIQIIEETGGRFEIDTAHEIADLIEQLSKDNLPPAVRKELAEALLPIAENAAARSDYETARRLLAAATQSARKTNDSALMKQIAARAQEVGDAKKLFDAYRKAIEKIAESPDDPAANLAAGKYLCFVKQDWDKGLPHLAKGGDATLRQIAELELTAPANPEDQVKLGDLWWALFEQAKGPEKAEYADRCDKWYAAALPGLKGLTQTKVSKRIDELAGTHKPAAGAGSTTAAVERPAAGDASAAATTATTAKLIAKIKLAIRKETLVRSAAVSGRNGSAFVEIPPTGAILTGFNYTTVPEINGGELSSIQAIYWTPKGSVNGQRWGVESGPVQTVVAKKGYAVAGLHAGGSSYEVAWFDVIFAKLGATGLDMTDKYTGSWTGRKYWSPITLGENGQLVVGIFGAVNDSQAAGLGLVQLPEK